MISKVVYVVIVYNLQPSVIFVRRKPMVRPEFATHSREVVKPWFLKRAKVPTFPFSLETIKTS